MTTASITTVPPDGGWGYIIGASVVLTILTCFGHISSFGLIFNDFFVSTNTKIGTITIVQAVTATVVSFTGIITNVATKRYSVRCVAICGAISYTTGWVLIIFITSTYQMLLTNSLLQGFGVGILNTTVFSTYNSYFDKKRVMVMSICQLVIGLGAMVYPLLLAWLLETYGFRGTVLIQSAIVANTFVCAMSLHPVKWHLKTIDIYTEILLEKLPQPKSIVTNKSASVGNLTNEIENQKNVYQIVDKCRRNSIQNSTNCTTSVSILKDASLVHLESDALDKKTVDNGIWKQIVNFLDLDLLKDIVLLNIMLGIAIGMFTDYTFSLLLPLYLYSIGLTTPDIASCISLMATADVLSRAFLAILSKFYQFKSRDLFFYPLLATCIARIIFIQCRQYWTFLILLVIIGFLRGILNIPMHLVYAEYIPEKFTAAYGLSIFFMGNITMILSPIVGWIQDYTNSYAVVFYVLSALPLLCLIPWTIEYWYFKRKSQRYRNK